MLTVNSIYMLIGLGVTLALPSAVANHRGVFLKNFLPFLNKIFMMVTSLL